MPTQRIFMKPLIKDSKNGYMTFSNYNYEVTPEHKSYIHKFFFDLSTKVWLIEFDWTSNDEIPAENFQNLDFIFCQIMKTASIGDVNIQVTTNFLAHSSDQMLVLLGNFIGHMLTNSTVNKKNDFNIRTPQDGAGLNNNKLATLLSEISSKVKKSALLCNRIESNWLMITKGIDVGMTWENLLLVLDIWYYLYKRCNTKKAVLKSLNVTRPVATPTKKKFMTKLLTILSANRDLCLKQLNISNLSDIYDENIPALHVYHADIQKIIILEGRYILMSYLSNLASRFPYLTEVSPTPVVPSTQYLRTAQDQTLSVFNAERIKLFEFSCQKMMNPIHAHPCLTTVSTSYNWNNLPHYSIMHPKNKENIHFWERFIEASTTRSTKLQLIGLDKNGSEKQTLSEADLLKILFNKVDTLLVKDITIGPEQFSRLCKMKLVRLTLINCDIDNFSLGIDNSKRSKTEKDN